MAKVSIGLRGWRFEESEVFTETGEFRPLMEIPKEARQRLVRLSLIVERPCDACHLVHGDANKQRCRQATIVYGEPLDEVLLCDVHEADFIYWFREEGGRDLVETERFRDAFHEWFAAGGRAPEGYAGLDHVDTDPDALPDPPDPDEIQRRLEEESGFEGERINLRERAGLEAMQGDEAAESGDQAGEDDADEDDDLDVDVDLGADYPTR